MKTVGIIGGLGPETTAEFYLEISFGCQQKDSNNRPHILISSVPIAYDVEREAMLHGTGENRCLQYLTNAAKELEKAGADFLVMPCNTLHIFIHELRSATKLPVLSIVEETAKFLQRKGAKKVGILATLMSLKHDLYKRELQRNNIEQVIPDDFEEAKVGKMIHNIVSNRHSNKDRESLLAVVNNFEKQGVDTVVLACTDLQLLIPRHPTIEIVDTMKIFADVTIDHILKD